MATPNPAMLMPDTGDPDAGPGPVADGEVSLRSWLRRLRDADQLRQIQCEVDSNLEPGAITRINLGLARPGRACPAVPELNRLPEYSLDPYCGLRTGQQTATVCVAGPGAGNR